MILLSSVPFRSMLAPSHNLSSFTPAVNWLGGAPDLPGRAEIPASLPVPVTSLRVTSNEAFALDPKDRSTLTTEVTMAKRYDDYPDGVNDLADPTGDTSWMKKGRCAHLSPSIFFPSDGVGVEAARRICVECSVKVQCLEYALANRIDHGVWGGTSERQRRRILRSRKIKLAAASSER